MVHMAAQNRSRPRVSLRDANDLRTVPENLCTCPIPSGYAARHDHLDQPFRQLGQSETEPHSCGSVVLCAGSLTDEGVEERENEFLRFQVKCAPLGLVAHDCVADEPIPGEGTGRVFCEEREALRHTSKG